MDERYTYDEHKWSVLTRGKGREGTAERESKLSLGGIPGPPGPEARPFRDEPQRTCQQGTANGKVSRLLGAKSPPACMSVWRCVCGCVYKKTFKT